MPVLCCPNNKSTLVTSPKGHLAAIIVAVRLLWGSGSSWGREVLWVEAAVNLMRKSISEFQRGNGTLFDVLCIKKEAVAGVIPCSTGGSQLEGALQAHALQGQVVKDTRHVTGRLQLQAWSRVGWLRVQ